MERTNSYHTVDDKVHFVNDIAMFTGQLSCVGILVVGCFQTTVVFSVHVQVFVRWYCGGWKTENVLLPVRLVCFVGGVVGHHWSVLCFNTLLGEQFFGVGYVLFFGDLLLDFLR